MTPPTLDQLPKPPPGKTGWPWTAAEQRLTTTDYRLPTTTGGTSRDCGVASSSVHSVDSVPTPVSRHSHLGTQAPSHSDTETSLRSPVSGLQSSDLAVPSPQSSVHSPQSSSLPRISIVTPSFNQGQFIEETIRSVLLQGYPNLEYIIIDGGSTDNTVEIIKKYEPWLTYWVSEKDKGQSHAINKGWSRVTGDIVAYINSDDTYQPEAFSRIAEFFTHHPDIDFVYGACQFINEMSHDIHLVDAPPYSLRALLTSSLIPQPSTFMRRRAIQSLGEFDTSLHFVFDYEYWVRAALQGHRFLAYSHPQPLANFRVWNNSKTGSQALRFMDEKRAVLHNAYNRPSMPGEIRATQAAAMAEIEYYGAVVHYRAGKMSEARDQLQKMRSICPRSVWRWNVISLYLKSLLGPRCVGKLRSVKARWRSNLGCAAL